MDINKYLEEHKIIDTYPGMSFQHRRVIPHIKCVDGFSLSVQVGHTHYCEPKNVSGPYTSVEVGFPSEKEDLLMEWAEDTDDPTNTVYGWVPVDVVEKVIDKHGGIKS